MFIGQIDLFTCNIVILKAMLIKEIDFLIVQKIYIDYVENYQQQFLSITRLQSFTLDNVQWPIWNLDWIKLLIISLFFAASLTVLFLLLPFSKYLQFVLRWVLLLIPNNIEISLRHHPLPIKQKSSLDWNMICAKTSRACN